MQISNSPRIAAELRRRFGSASRVVVLTGAGVSAESGVPTFRGGGNSTVWKGMPFDVISSAEMVERDLPAVWEWFDYRRDFMEVGAAESRRTLRDCALAREAFLN